jgi:transposase
VFTLGKHYDQEYKDYVSKLVVEDGRKASDVAFELEISPKTISRWVATYRMKVNVGKSNETYITPSELEKLKNSMRKN